MRSSENLQTTISGSYQKSEDMKAESQIFKYPFFHFSGIRDVKDIQLQASILGDSNTVT